MTNGNINLFVEEHWDVNRFELVGLPFKLLQPSVTIDDRDFGSWEMSRRA
jgi:hypothetical protein